MSLNVAWLMERPTTLDEQTFEDWYLDGHAAVARRLPGLRRYAVSRLVEEPNRLTDSTVFRVAQLYWDDIASATAAFNSLEGLATFGDGTVHAGGASYTEWLSLTHDEQLPVTRSACFDIVSGRFVSQYGQVVKLLSYGTGPGTEIVERYRRDHGDLGRHPLVRQHLVGRREPEPLRPGFLTVPGPNDLAADWSTELWFDSVADAEELLATPDYQAAWGSLTKESELVFRGVFRSQELFCSVPAVAFDPAGVGS